jgi:hypothetical protein
MNREMDIKIKKVKFKGVTKDKTTEKYRADIKIDGKCKYLGSFSSENNAAIAYNNAAIKYFGEFASLNENVYPEVENILNKNNTSGFIGVYIYKGKRGNTYRASLGRGRNAEHSKSFNNIIDAAKAYNEMASKRYGEKAKLNKIED